MRELDILKFQCRNIRSFGNPPPIVQNHFRLDTLTATYQTETFGKFERSNTVGRTGRQVIFRSFRNLRIKVILQQHGRKIVFRSYRNGRCRRSGSTERYGIIRLVVLARFISIVYINCIKRILRQPFNFRIPLQHFINSEITAYSR